MLPITKLHNTYVLVLNCFQAITKKFLEEFLKCLTISLTHQEKSPNVERTLDFAAEFAVSFCSALDENDNCPLLEGVFQFIFDVSLSAYNSVTLLSASISCLPVSCV